MRNPISWFLGLLMFCALTMEIAAKGIVLTREGAPAASIVLDRAPNNSAVFAAVELQDHIRKITGATLPMVTDEEDVKGARILVGESEATRSLGLRSADFEPQEYLIRFLPNTLILMGRDKADAFSVTVQGKPQWVDGRHGKALQFNGVDDAVAVAGGFSDAAGTLEAWVCMKEAQPDGGAILRLDGRNPWTYHILQRKAGGVEYVTYDGSAANQVASGRLNEGWHHVMATFEGQTRKMELFVDGKSQGTAKYTTTTCQNSALCVGGIPPSIAGIRKTGCPLAGMIDEVRVSNIVRAPATESREKAAECDQNTTVLLHFDEGQGMPHRQDQTFHRNSGPDFYDEQGTCYAVYDFLERFGNVRWYAPTDLGMVYPSAPTLEIRGKEIRRKPAFEFRHHAHSTYTISQMTRILWNNPTQEDLTLFIHRMRLGGKNDLISHSLYGYYDRFWKKNPDNPEIFEGEHPEYFAKGYSGQPPQLCYSNPALVAQVARDARDYFDGKGAKFRACAIGDCFSVVPMDNNDYCKCATCQAQFNAEQADNPQFSNGKWSNYFFGFVNRVAQEVSKSHPHKWIGAAAYMTYAHHPTNVRLEPNIAVELCLHTRNWWCPSMKRSDLTVYQGWTQKEPGRPLGLWLYYCFPQLNGETGGFKCFPGFFAHTAAEQIRMFARDGIRGVYAEGVGEQVDAYVLFKMMDDPRLDVDRLLDEFFSRYYGAAGKPMKQLYLKIEKIFMDPANYPEEVRKEVGAHQTEEFAWGYLGTEARMAEMGDLVGAAEGLAKTEAERARVALFKKAVWDHMVAGRRKYLEKTLHADEVKKLREQAPPSIQVPRIDGSGVAGDSSKVDWAKAAVLRIDHSVEGYPSTHRAEARIAHDGAWLYLRLLDECDTSTLVSQEGVWGGDDWEVFVAAQRDKPYYQMGVNPAGAQQTLMWGNDGHWDSGLKTHSEVKPKVWLATMSVPLARVAPPGLKPGGKFYLNIIRGTTGGNEPLAWSPHFALTFHDPSRLGECVLAE